MSDQSKPAEIEDVLSSIRKLVSGGAPGASARSRQTAIEEWEDGAPPPQERTEPAPSADDMQRDAVDALHGAEHQPPADPDTEDGVPPQEDESSEHENPVEDPPARPAFLLTEAARVPLDADTVDADAADHEHEEEPDSAIPGATGQESGVTAPEEPGAEADEASDPPRHGFGFTTIRRDDPARHVPLHEIDRPGSSASDDTLDDMENDLDLHDTGGTPFAAPGNPMIASPDADSGAESGAEADARPRANSAPASQDIAEERRIRLARDLRHHLPDHPTDNLAAENLAAEDQNDEGFTADSMAQEAPSIDGPAPSDRVGDDPVAQSEAAEGNTDPEQATDDLPPTDEMLDGTAVDEAQRVEPPSPETEDEVAFPDAPRAPEASTQSTVTLGQAAPAETGPATDGEERVSDALEDEAQETLPASDALDQEGAPARADEAERAGEQPDAADAASFLAGATPDLPDAAPSAAERSGRSPVNLFGDDETGFDEEALRALIAEVVHRELQGTLGQRVSGNIRSLVRREIAKALEERGLE